MTRAARWFELSLVCVRVMMMSLLIAFAIHLVAAYFGWSIYATAE